MKKIDPRNKQKFIGLSKFLQHRLLTFFQLFPKIDCLQSSIKLLATILLLTGCSSDRKLLNEDNPFYSRGIELKLDGNIDAAKAAFQQCLKHSPESDKAYLQLAIIFEDHGKDYPQAIAQYKEYIKRSSDTENKEAAQRWLSRVEEKYYKLLHKTYAKKEVFRRPHVPPKRPTIKKRSSEQLAQHKSQKESLSDQRFSNLENLAATEYSKQASAQQSDNQNSSTYVVRDGDTLVRIASRLLGDQQEWTKIYELNKDVIQSPRSLRIGQKLRIPFPPKKN